MQSEFKKNSTNIPLDVGNIMYQWAKDLWPINRSITGQGVRSTLTYIKNLLPTLALRSIESQVKVFDWTIPDEWNLREAYIADLNGKRIIDFRNNNLHVVGYSVPVDQIINFEELKKFIHYLPDNPKAIPYVTSYYKKSWGFCMSYEQFLTLKDSKYKIKIDSDLKLGKLNYADLLIKGSKREEILLSTYICHPSMANNELSGIVVTTALAQWLESINSLRYSYRIVFVPETIGSIAYLSKNIELMQRNTIAGFVVTCVGDNKNYSYLPTRTGKTLADRVSLYVLKNYVKKFNVYSFLQRGSDERQYCSPNINLPVCSLMRSKYGEYSEYHTSLDDLTFISPEGLAGGYEMIKKCIEILEINAIYRNTVFGEPQLGPRGLYGTTSNQDPDALSNILAYVDGQLDLLEIAEIIGIDIFECHNLALKLLANNLIEECGCNVKSA